MVNGNIWDQGGRYGIHVDPPVFFEWTLKLPRDELYFVGWADTRNVPFHPDPDRIWDTVARFDNLDEGGEPWAVITEVQSQPDALILGRIHVYGGSLWLEQKPDPEPGSRYHVSALVVNLTGRSTGLTGKTWRRTKLKSLEAPVFFDIATKRAATILTQIENGTLGLAILLWIPLMQGGDKKSIIQHWKVLAEQETDRKKKSDYAALAILFAEKTGCQAIWREHLEGWNMEESAVVKEWTKEAEERGEKRGEKRGKQLGEKRGKQLGEKLGERNTLVEVVTVLLTKEFGEDGIAFAKELAQMEDADKLRAVFHAAINDAALDELRSLANLS